MCGRGGVFLLYSGLLPSLYGLFPISHTAPSRKVWSDPPVALCCTLWNSIWIRRGQSALALTRDQPAQGHLWTRLVPWATIFEFTNLATQPAEGRPPDCSWWRLKLKIPTVHSCIRSNRMAPGKINPFWSGTLTVTPANYCDSHFLNALSRT